MILLFNFIIECWLVGMPYISIIYSCEWQKIRKLFKADDSFSLTNLNSVIFRLKNVLNQIQRWFGSQSGCPVRPPEGNSFFKTGNAVLLNSSHRVEQPQDKYPSFRKHFRHVLFKLFPLFTFVDPFQTYNLLTDVGGQQCPCPVLVSFFPDFPKNRVRCRIGLLSGFCLSRFCPLSGFCPDFR